MEDNGDILSDDDHTVVANVSMKLDPEKEYNELEGEQPVKVQIQQDNQQFEILQDFAKNKYIEINFISPREESVKQSEPLPQLRLSSITSATS